jgi:hypothetical protein
MSSLEEVNEAAKGHSDFRIGSNRSTVAAWSLWVVSTFATTTTSSCIFSMLHILTAQCGSTIRSSAMKDRFGILIRALNLPTDLRSARKMGCMRSSPAASRQSLEQCFITTEAYNSSQVSELPSGSSWLKSNLT